MEGQDWTPVVIRKKKPTGAEAKSNTTINQAFRSGQAQTVKKHNAGSNRMSTAGAGKSAAKLENETEELHHETVSGDLKRAIQQGRIAKKLTQAQLAQAINEKLQIVQDYENGRAIPNGQILNKLSRVLGVPLSNKGKAKPKKK